jgi:hypothetical protein
MGLKRKFRKRLQQLKDVITDKMRDHDLYHQAKKNFRKNKNLSGYGIRKQYSDEVQRYWRKNYGGSIRLIWHRACTAVTGVEDVRFIPHNVWWLRILPFFNSLAMRPAYNDKNLANNFFVPENGVATIIKRMHGVFYDENNDILTFEQASSRLLNTDCDIVIKSSQTDDGIGITPGSIRGHKLFMFGSFSDLTRVVEIYKNNLVIQQRIVQHPLLAKLHPQSVNTVRILTFRWHGEIKPLLAFLRIGRSGRITDNAGTGGICVGIADDGLLNSWAVDQFGSLYEAHPTTDYSFRRQKYVPGFSEACREACEYHKKIFHFDLVSWDFAIGPEDRPIFLEMNFRGASWIYQFACAKPIFGDFTEEVLQLLHVQNLNRGDNRLVALPRERGKS